MKPYIFETHCGLGASKKPKTTITLIPTEGRPGAPKVSPSGPAGRFTLHDRPLGPRRGNAVIICVTQNVIHPLGLNPAIYKP